MHPQSHDLCENIQTNMQAGDRTDPAQEHWKETIYLDLEP